MKLTEVLLGLQLLEYKKNKILQKRKLLKVY